MPQCRVKPSVGWVRRDAENRPRGPARPTAWGRDAGLREDRGNASVRLALQEHAPDPLDHRVSVVRDELGAVPAIAEERLRHCRHPTKGCACAQAIARTGLRTQDRSLLAKSESQFEELTLHAIKERRSVGNQHLHVALAALSEEDEPLKALS